jgi:hypothetical protein
MLHETLTSEDELDDTPIPELRPRKNVYVQATFKDQDTDVTLDLLLDSGAEISLISSTSVY